MHLAHACSSGAPLCRALPVGGAGQTAGLAAQRGQGTHENGKTQQCESSVEHLEAQPVRRPRHPGSPARPDRPATPRGGSGTVDAAPQPGLPLSCMSPVDAGAGRGGGGAAASVVPVAAQATATSTSAAARAAVRAMAACLFAGAAVRTLAASHAPCGGVCWLGGGAGAQLPAGAGETTTPDTRRTAVALHDRRACRAVTRSGARCRSGGYVCCARLCWGAGW